MTYCANCGAKLLGNESFCPYCGELFENKKELTKDSTKSQIEALQNEVSYLKDKINAQKTPDQSLYIPQQKQESNLWKCCCIIILLLMIFGLVPFTIYFQ